MPINNPRGGAGDILPNYWNPQRLEPSTILPSNYLDSRPVAGIGAWGAWRQVAPAIAQDLVLAALHVNLVTTQPMSCWLQIGVDPAGGSSYVIFTTSGMHAGLVGSGAYPLHGATLRLPAMEIVPGCSIGIRAWKTGGNTGVAAYLSLIPEGAAWHSPWPVAYIQSGTAMGQYRVPFVPNWLTSQRTPVWTEAIAAVTNDTLLTAAEWDPLLADGVQGDVIEVGVGPAGSEVVAARVGIPSYRVYPWTCGYQEFARKAMVFAGERVSVRHNLLADPARVALYCEDGPF